MAARIYGTNYADIIKQNGYIAVEIFAMTATTTST